MGLIDAPGERPAYRSRNFELYFETDDIEDLHQRLSAASVAFIHGIREHPWRQRAMRLYDPDHHIIEVGEPMDAVIRRLSASGLSKAQIHEATSMPLAVIESVTA
jgi:hypothetical protein